MRKILLALLVIGSLSGCAATTKLPAVETQFVDRVEYVVRVPPAELTTLPKMPEHINVNTATQATVAQWVIDTESYMLTLRNQLIGIAKFLNNSQIELDEKAKKENSSILKPLKPL